MFEIEGDFICETTKGMSQKEKDFEKALSAWIEGDSSMETTDLLNLSENEEEEIADQLMIHGLLMERANRENTEEERIKAVLERIREKRGQEKVVSFQRYGIWIGGIAASLILMFWVFIGSGENLMADNLDRVISASLEPIARTYSITVLEESEVTPVKQEKNVEDLDGATLTIGGKDLYVFTRRLSNGYIRISGCDGKESWAMREDGPVHVSSDLNRFTGILPGRRNSSSFVNLPVFLQQLKDSFIIEQVEQEKDAKGLISFRCVRKSELKFGARIIELLVDATTWQILEVHLSGMPQSRGGPRSIQLKLVDTSPFNQSFFSHNYHHEPEREIRMSTQK